MPWFYYLLATFYVLSCLLLLLVVLLQQGKGGDMASAFGGGSSQTAFGARAGATVLTRATSVLGVLFMIGAIVLGIIGRQGPGSIMSGVAGPPPVARAREHGPNARTGSGRIGEAFGAGGEPRRSAAAAVRAETGRTDAGEEVSRGRCGGSPSRKWRNWQTHQLEGLALARAWGFESPLSHHSTRLRARLRRAGRLAHGGPSDTSNALSERSESKGSSSLEFLTQQATRSCPGASDDGIVVS